MNMDLFEKALQSLEPEQRLQQLLWQESGKGMQWGGTIVSRSEDRTFQKKVAKLVVTELKNMKGTISDITTALLRNDGHQGHCQDINILKQLFDHGRALMDEDYLEIVLDKTPKNIKHKLLANYEGGWAYNILMDIMLNESNQKKSKKMIDFLQKHFDTEQLMNALRDVDNPKYNAESVLQKICEKGDINYFRVILSIYKKDNVQLDAEFGIRDGDSLLHRAMANRHDHIPKQIFNEIKNDAKKMEMINHRRRIDGKCLLDIAQSESNKQLLKRTVFGIVGKVEKTKMEYSQFIPYFYWLIKEKELDSIKALMTVFGGKDSISKFVGARNQSRRNAFHITCAHADRRRNHEIIGYLLSGTNDDDLRTLLMAKDNAGCSPLAYAPLSCRLFVLEYVRKRNQQLVKELLLDSDALLLTECLSSARDLREMFKFCTDDLLLDRSLIVQLSFGVKWSSDGDEIRKLIVDAYNDRVGNGPVVTEMPENALRAKSSFMESFEDLDEAEEIGMARSDNRFMDSVGPFLHPMDSWPIEDPVTGNSSLALCLMGDNRKLFGEIMVKLEDEDIATKHLMQYTNYKGSTLLHMAATRKENRQEYCEQILKKLTSQSHKNRLLLARDIDGNNIMHLLAIHAPHYTPDENRDFWTFIRNALGKKYNAANSLRLLMQVLNTLNLRRDY